MLKILQDAESSVILTRVKVGMNSEAILKPSNITPTITILRQYFDRLFPNTKVGNLNPSIRIAFNNDQEKIPGNV